MRLRLLSASTGFSWVREGFALFRRQPIRLTLLVAACMLSAGMVSRILPVIGFFVLVSFTPLIALIVMIAAKQMQENKSTSLVIVIRLLINETRAGKIALAQLCAIYATVFLLLLGLSALLDGGIFMRVYTGQQELTLEILESESFFLVSFVVGVGYLLMNALFLYAPALIYWHKTSAAQAIFYSAVACVRNAGALFCYFLLWGGFGFLSALAAVFVVQALLMVGVSIKIAAIVFLMFIFAFSAALHTSVIFALRDTFES